MVIKKSYSRVVFFLLLLLLFSCGQGFQRLEKNDLISFTDTQYLSDIKTPNKEIGWAKVHSVNSQLLVKIKLFGPPSEHKHLQVLHQNQSCASFLTLHDELFFTHLGEAENKFGKVVLIFDAKINHRLDSIKDLPKIKKRGFYHYYRAADINILYLLGMEEFVKFELENQILMIYKFESENLQFHPIACGEFVSG